MSLVDIIRDRADYWSMASQPSAVAQAMKRDGFYFPLPVLTREEAANALEQLRSWEASRGPGGDGGVDGGVELRGDDRFDLHLLLPWAASLVRHPALLAAARESLGTDDVLVWSSDVNVKPPRSGRFASPHQDSAYAGLRPASGAITAWIALSDAPAEAGCMAFAPGSHLLGPLPHAETSADENMLAFGQTIEEGRRGDVVGGVVGALMAGEASLHSFRTVHWSGPNATDARRVGLAIRYVRADISREERAAAPTTRETATLVSGTYDPATGSFDLEPVPLVPAGEDEVRAHAESLARQRANYFGGDAAGRTRGGFK